MSGRSSGSKPYSVTESNAVDSRVAGWPSASRWKRRLVRTGPPSPANMRAGSSSSRLSGNTPAVNGKCPGRFSPRSQRTSSPASSKRGQRHARDRRAGQRLARQRGASSGRAARHVLVAGAAPRAASRRRRQRRRVGGARRASVVDVGGRLAVARRASLQSPRAAAGGGRRRACSLGGRRGSRGPSRRSRRGSARGWRARSTPTSRRRSSCPAAASAPVVGDAGPCPREQRRAGAGTAR